MNVVTIIGVVAAYALVFIAVICLFAEKGIHPFRRLRRKFAKLPLFAKLLVLVFGVTLFVHGSLKSPMNFQPRSAPIVQQITDDDVERGFVLASISTNSQFSILNSQFPTASQITTNLKWKLRGAHEDWFAAESETNAPWAFQFGTNLAESVVVHSGGMVEVGRRAPSPPQLWPFKAPLGIVPEANWKRIAFQPFNLSTFSPSLFWHAATPSNTLLLTWQNVLLERDTNMPVSVQAELWPNGRFTYRYDLRNLESRVQNGELDGDTLTNIVIGANLKDAPLQLTLADLFDNSQFSLLCQGYGGQAILNSQFSISFHPVSAEDLANPDRDGDGLLLLEELRVHHTDPDLFDTSGDGISDGEAVSLGLDPLLRHVSDSEILERVAASATNEIFAAARVAVTNSMLAWRLFDGFAADMPPGATNVLWERTFPVDRSSPLVQCFISANPSNAAPWRLEGAVLEWETDEGASGSASASPIADSLRIPLSAEGRPASITLRLRAVGSFVRSPTPIDLIAYAPEIKVEGGRDVSLPDGRMVSVFTNGSASAISVSLDRSRRPCRAAVTADERDETFVADLSMGFEGGCLFDGDGESGVLTPLNPTVYTLPALFADVPAAPMRGGSGTPSPARGGHGGPGHEILVIAPSVWYGEDHCHFGGFPTYLSEEDRFELGDSYPFDSLCVKGGWNHGLSGTWICDCTPGISSGIGDDPPYLRHEGHSSDFYYYGMFYIGDVCVWSGHAVHVRNGKCEEWGVSFDAPFGDSCGGCSDGCADGNCDGLEGASLGSLRFRIPLGMPRQGQVSGFLYFTSDGPTNITAATFQLLARGDADVTDAALGSSRRVVCRDERGRDISVDPMANGVRVTIRTTSTQALEHTWEIVNENGSPCRVRLRKISRLGNVMSDETFDCSGGDWTRFDNGSQTSESLVVSGDVNDWMSGFTRGEERTVRDASGAVISRTYEESRLFGEADGAVLRTTYREEDTGMGTIASEADYWDDQSSGRHGKLRLLVGDSRPWEYHDFDYFGRETIRVEQRDGSPVPESFPVASSNGLEGALGLDSAFVTVFAYDAMPGDGSHGDDLFRPRMETRYAVSGGVPTPIGRTWRRLSRTTVSGAPAVKEETWRAATPEGAAADSPAPDAAYSWRMTFDENEAGVPLVARGRPAGSLDEDGVLSAVSLAEIGGAVALETRRSLGGIAFPTYETEELDAAHGTTLRRTTRLSSGGAVVASEESVYDEKNRLRSTTHLDGTSSTNAYSCCRLLWSRDRQNRRMLRSAQTGTDHLYHANEDVWLGDVSTNGQHRVTQHFFDALGRETNTVAYIGATPGEAVVATGGTRSVASATTTSYPYGGSDYAVSTDERGAVTERCTYRNGECEESDENVYTNDVFVVSTRTTRYRNGATVVRREWLSDVAVWSWRWTEETRSASYAPDGRRVETVVTDSSDCGAATNSVTIYDLLGRVATTAVPGANGAWLVTSNTYDGATTRILASTLHVPGLQPRTTQHLYNDFGEQVGTILDDVTERTDTTYETDSSNVAWKVETSVVVGPDTNSLRIVRTQLSGLSDACRRHTVELVGRSPRDRRTESTTVFDPATGIETETITSSTDSTVVRRSMHGLVLSTGSDGETTVNAYDAFGRVAATGRAASLAAPIGTTNVSPVESFTYAPCGDLLAAHTYTNAADCVTETYAYDMLGNLVSTTDAHGNSVFKSYDPFGNVTAEWGATYPVCYAYDTQNRRTTLSTTRDGATWDTTTWTYEPRTGLCTSKTYADGSTVSYTYTPDNLPLRTTYASGRWRENVYDATRRLTGVIYSSSEMNREIQNDAYGNATNVQDAAGNEWRYEYGFDSALVGEERIDAGGPRSVAATNVVVHAYDPCNRPSGHALAIDGASRGGVGYEYDPDGHFAHISATNAAGRSFAVAYTNAAGLNYGYTITTPGGDTIRRVVERDQFRRSLVTNCATFFNAATVDSNAYSFDALLRPVERTSSRTGGPPVHSAFAYNERSEVLSAAIGTNIFAHAYDCIGNHTLHAANGVTNVYEHNSLNQYAAVFDPAEPMTTQYALEYDIDGGMATDWEWDFEYDAADRLSSVSPTFLEDGALRVLNEYDYRNRRIRKIVQRLTITLPPPPSPPIETHTWNTIETRTFVYDDWNLIHETIYTIDGGTTNTTEVQYFWGLDLSDTLHSAGGVGGLLAVSCEGQFYFPAYDNNGNVTRYIDESGNVVATYEYNDFGKLISYSGPLADLFRFRFSTKYCDPETGLYYYGERFYYPYWHIWLNRDPIGESGGLNIYSFCGNHPIEGIDLLGLKIRSAVTPSKCSNKDIDAEARKVLANAVVFTQEGSPRLEHYGNLCCACRKGKYEVIVTGPIPGKIVVSYSQYKGRSYKQETPASFPDDPRIRCPQGSQRVGYYHTHVSGRSFSNRDLDVLKTRDHPYYMSQDGRRIEKAVPLRTDNPIQAGFPSTAIAPGGFPMHPIVITLE